jgi:hypothetical protein
LEWKLVLYSQAECEFGQDPAGSFELARPHGNANSKVLRDAILESNSHDVGQKPNAGLTVHFSTVQEPEIAPLQMMAEHSHAPKVMLGRWVLIEVTWQTAPIWKFRLDKGEANRRPDAIWLVRYLYLASPCVFLRKGGEVCIIVKLSWREVP